MLAYTLRKLVTGVAIFLAVTLLTFWMLFARGGTYIASQALGQQASPDQVRRFAENRGLLEPIIVQYVDWLRGVLNGSLGRSILNGQDVGTMLAGAVSVTLSLVVVSIVLTVLLAIPFGVAAATTGGVIDRGLQLLSVFVQAIPGYWLALVLDIIFGLTLKLVPATGFVPLTQSFGGWLSSIILPSFAIALGAVAFVGTQLRGTLLEVLRQDYIRTLRSRGISTRRVLLKYALRNASAPVLTILSLQVIGILGGAVIIERIYALPGVGTIAIAAGNSADVPVVMGTVAFMVVVVVVVNLLTEILNGFVNPKMRLK
ncbi:ABC transporter permease [Streptomyces sp. NPDC020917]|uniref:ABC transporter permease n=1 Tax=Streptomyces sp. NPDC020917 TaxID=3365102 RepID=UPI0037971B36